MAVLKRWPAAEGVDDLFVARYGQLVTWALQFVGPDRSAAEDLVHDTFLRVALRHRDARQIQNVEAYLFVTMRNVHLSQVRRQSARPASVVTLADFESLEASLLASRAQQDRQAAYDELSLIARYACLRKSSSKGASALRSRTASASSPGLGTCAGASRACSTWPSRATSVWAAGETCSCASTCSTPPTRRRLRAPDWTITPALTPRNAPKSD